MNFQIIIILLISCICAFIAFKIMAKFKVPKVGCIALVTGGVKTGKSTFAVNLAIKNYKRVHRAWSLRSRFQKMFGIEPEEEPLLYSNIPLAVPFVMVTKDLLLRNTRPRYKSVMYINEASLVADSQLFRDMEINERLMFFNKLFGHETKGGFLVYDTQCIVDLHYSIKRCISEYFYIHHLQKHFPFILCAQIREERFSEDGSAVNNYNEDVESSLKKVLISKKIWKKFDAYCFSYLTDNLPVEDKVICCDKNNLKATEIVSFRDFVTIDIKKGGKKENEKTHDNKSN